MDTQRPEDSVAFEIRPQGLALQAPASSGSQASFLDCAANMFFFGGASFPLKFSLRCQCSISLVKKHGVSWSVSFTEAGSRGRKKAQESVGKDEDWVHSGHRLNLPLEARPEMELEAGDGDRCLKSKGRPGSLD